MTGRAALVADYVATLGFPLDDFQRLAADELVAGRSVLVAAPTGAGKTVVGELACYLALRSGERAFYTTPIKALSNQKYRDLIDRYGSDQVGLLTGDRSVNGDAPIVVMTTEVLRNMIYEASPALDRLGSVVLDEVHYLADRARGAVWEEVIIHLDRRVSIAALSATVSNAETFGTWLDQVRGGCTTIVEEHRPVPLRHHYFVNGRVFPTFQAGRKQGASRSQRERASQALGGVPNPDVVMLERQAQQRNRVTNRGRRLAPAVRLRWPSRGEVVEELAHRKWLPAILFVFSRAGCDAAVEQLVRAGVQLTTSHERHEILTTADTLLADVPPEDLEALGYDAWRDMLGDGVAPHHAGMVPAFKECVEQLFQRGLLKVVVATETLALGINMPARTVVIERLEKWDGDRHVLLTPGEYTQLAGRAGRRGIDDVGHCVVLHQRSVDFSTVASLVGTRTYPLASSFGPSYNMAVNLLRHHDLVTAEQLLGASFAQFEADASVARAASRLAELDEAIGGYSQHLTCDRGDWPAYWELRQQLQALDKQQEARRRQAGSDDLKTALGALRPGDVITTGPIDAPKHVAVIGVQVTKGGTPIAQVVTAQGSLTRVGPRELSGIPRVVDRIHLPRSGNPRQRDFRQQLARTLRTIAAGEGSTPRGDDEHGAVRDAQEPGRHADPGSNSGAGEGLEDARRAARRALQEHPCHRCDERDRHETWQRRVDEAEAEAQRLRSRVARATGSLVRRFTAIRHVLTELNYLDVDQRPTRSGMQLARIYNEADLVVVEAVSAGAVDDLDHAELAAWASLFVYEPRGADPTPVSHQPTTSLQHAAAIVEHVAAAIAGRERAAGLQATRELDAGFAAIAWRWAQGADLDHAVGDLDLTGGDFVRNMKQIADLLGQLANLGDADLTRRARAATDAIRRGIVEA